jgi:hypothetical protein
MSVQGKAMWSLTSRRVKRISGPEKSRLSDGNDFFNSIGQKATSPMIWALVLFAAARNRRQTTRALDFFGAHYRHHSPDRGLYL